MFSRNRQSCSYTQIHSISTFNHFEEGEPSDNLSTFGESHPLLLSIGWDQYPMGQSYTPRSILHVNHRLFSYSVQDSPSPPTNLLWNFKFKFHVVYAKGRLSYLFLHHWNLYACRTVVQPPKIFSIIYIRKTQKCLVMLICLNFKNKENKLNKWDILLILDLNFTW